MRQPFQRPVLRYRVAAAASSMVDGYDNVPQTLDGGLAEHGAAAHGRRGTVPCGHDRCQCAFSASTVSAQVMN